MLYTRRLWSGFLFLSLSGLAAPLPAATGPTISGTVSDPSGAVIAGAQVELSQGQHRIAATTTDRQGEYELAMPTPGVYELRISASGFRTELFDGVRATGSQGTTRDAMLHLDALAQNVTVTATGTPTLQTHSGAAVTVLTAADYAGSEEVQDALRWIPGLQLTQTGQRGGTTGLFIRGGNDDSSQVLIDGIPMNDIGGAVEFANIASSAIAKVEVLRGPNSSIYGPDAMTGVVSLSTARGTTPLPQISYLASGGNFATYQQEGNLGGTWKRFDYFSDYSRFDTSNSLPDDRFHAGTFSGNYGWAVNPNASLRATVHHDQVVGGDPDALLLYGIPSDAQQRNEDGYFGVTFEDQSAPRWHNLLRYGGVRLRSQYTEFAPTGIPQFFDGALAGYLGAPITVHGANGYTVSGQAQYQYVETYPYSYPTSTDRDFVETRSDYRITSHMIGLFGFRFENERGYSGAASDSVERNNYNYTIQFQGDIKGRLFYTAGTGVEKDELFGIAATPRVSLSYTLRPPGGSGLFDGTRLRGSFGKGVKEPSLLDQTSSLYAELAALPNGAQLIRQYGVAQIGAEWSRSYDAGVDQGLLGGRIQAGLTYYHNEFTNGIEYIPQQGLIDLGVPASVAAAATYGATVNSQAFRAQGIETEVHGRISHDWSARGGYTYLDAVVQRSFSSDAIGPSYNPSFPTIPIGVDTPLIGARPFRRAPHTGYFGLQYAHQRVSALLTGSLVGRRDDSDFLSDDANYLPTLLLPNRNLDGAYQRLDLSASYQASHAIRLFSDVQNLLSEHYSEAFGYPALPFTFRSGMQITLGGESWKWR